MREAAESLRGEPRLSLARKVATMLVLLAVLRSAHATQPAAALELRGHGPTVAFGYASERGDELFFPSLGWRWRWGMCDAVTSMMEKIGTDLTWYVEPMASPVVGDQTTVELQVVPGLRVEGLRPWIGAAVPYLEGGIGLMYTGLDDIGLGSNILFSDNVGIGFTIADSGWSFGYRYRHSSHAGLWAESNAGLDVHYLTLRYDLPVADAVP